MKCLILLWISNLQWIKKLCMSIPYACTSVILSLIHRRSLITMRHSYRSWNSHSSGDIQVCPGGYHLCVDDFRKSWCTHIIHRKFPGSVFVCLFRQIPGYIVRAMEQGSQQAQNLMSMLKPVWVLVDDIVQHWPCLNNQFVLNIEPS